jgi:uncharacterized membrane protein
MDMAHRRARRRGRALVAAGLALALAAGCVKDLGLPPGEVTAVATDVNEHGTITVAAGTGDDAWTLSRDGRWTHLAPPPGFDPNSRLTPGAINGRGEVAGNLTGTTGPVILPFVWDEQAGSRLIPLTPTYGNSAFARDINDAGQVVGFTFTLPSIYGIGYLWDADTGELTVLDTPVGFAAVEPVAVNDAGQVAGIALAADGVTRAVVWAPPAYEPEVLPIAAPGRPTVTGIDDDGTVVGFHRADGVGVSWGPAPGRAVRTFPGFIPRATSGGNLVGSSGTFPYGQALWWGAGEDAPEPLGTRGGQSYASAIEGDYIVGGVQDGPDGPDHVARFAVNP